MNEKQWTTRAPEPEILAVRARLYDSGEFRLCRCFSTDQLTQVPSERKPSHSVELLGADQEIVSRQPLAVLPSPRLDSAGRYRKVVGSIALHEDAASLCILEHVDNERRARFTCAVPDRPTLDVRWDVHHVNPRETHELRLDGSPGLEGAFLYVAYEWAPGKRIPLTSGEVLTQVPIDFSNLPPSDHGRLLVLYGNGLRSIAKASPPFRVAGPRASIDILSPPNGAQYAPNSWVDLQANIAGYYEDDTQPDLIWYCDGEEVHRGITGSLFNLEPGEHVIELRIADCGTRSAQRTVTILSAYPQDWESHIKTKNNSRE